MINIYTIGPQEQYTLVLADWILERYKNNLHNVIIVLPTNIMCQALQRDILAQQGVMSAFPDQLAGFLPSIVSLKDLPSKFSANFTQHIPASDTQAQFLLANIIIKYPTICKDFYAALIVAKDMISLFEEIVEQECQFHDIRQYINVNPAASQDMLNIINILEEVYHEWQLALLKRQKFDSCRYQREFFLYYREVMDHRGQFADYHFVFANFTTYNMAICRFLTLQNCSVVLPPCHVDSKYIHIATFLTKLRKLSDITITSLTEFGLRPTSTHYFEFDSEYSEAGYIADQVLQMLNTGATPTTNLPIGIVCSNDYNTATIQLALRKHGITFDTCDGQPIAQSKIGTAAIHISNLYRYDVSIPDIMGIAYYIAPTMANKLHLALSGKFIESYNDILNVINTTSIDDFSGLYDWYKMVHTIVMPTQDALQNFSNYVGHIINATKALKFFGHDNSTIYITAEERGCFDFFDTLERELLGLDVSCISQSDYYMIFKMLLNNHKIYTPSNSINNVILLKPHNVSLNCSCVFLLGCTDVNWPSAPKAGMLSQDIAESFDLQKGHNPEVQKYYFDCILAKNNVYVTNALQYCGIRSSKSRLLWGQNLKTIDITYPKRQLQTLCLEISGPLSDVPKLPERISATDIETLLQNRYAFYAHKILKLYKLSPINPELSLADFGKIIHALCAKQVQNKLSLEQLMPEINLLLGQYPKLAAYLWKQKIINIMTAFIKLHNTQTINLASTKHYTEIAGSINIHYGNNKQLHLTAIADRIDVYDDKLTIIDYKTGAAPSIKDIKTGSSPQLIVESFILNNNGFFPIKINIELITLSYYKISFSEPYIHIISYDLTASELMLHFDACKNLLELCASADSIDFFNIPPLVERYNNYKHLQRIPMS